VKKLSGQLVARLTYALRQANEREMTKDAFIRLLTDTVKSEEMYCNLPEGEKPVPKGSHPRVENLDAATLEMMNVMLPWSSYYVPSPGKIIGTA
jgi:hypothetical protein